MPAATKPAFEPEAKPASKSLPPAEAKEGQPSGEADPQQPSVKTESSEVPAEAAARTVKRRDPLAERGADQVDALLAEEAAAGRTGGTTGRGIVYDDAGLDRLLDRSKLEAEGATGNVYFYSLHLCWSAVLLHPSLRLLHAAAKARQ